LDSERVANFVAHLETEVSAVTVKTQIKWLWDAIRVMAPDDDWDWLKTIVRQVSYRTKQQTQPPVVDSQCLFNLGLDLMRSAEVDDSTKEIVRATQYRDGLIIALLASRPLRRRTLASIHIGKQLKAIGGRWWLVFGPEDVKNRRALELPWPEALEAALQRYLARYRPCFDRADEIDALWVSQKGCALTADGIYQRISHLTREAFGEAVSPHRFRHAAASTISRHDPDHVMSITSVLGHASLDMAYRHYITAQGREASEAYQAILLNMRKEAKVQAKEKTRP
jgi:site-specific recombinase XerD